jgi:hypothetical protein
LWEYQAGLGGNIPLNLKQHAKLTDKAEKGIADLQSVWRAYPGIKIRPLTQTHNGISNGILTEGDAGKYI